MEQIGYSLIDASGAEVAYWGDTHGVLVGVPSSITLPSGDIVCGVTAPSQIGDFTLVQRFFAWGAADSIARIDRGVLVTRAVPSSMVDAERDRRIALGASVTIGGETFVAQTRDDRDFRNVNGLASKGIVMKMLNDASTVTFHDADNIDHALNADGLISMADQVASHVQTLYAKSWALKSMSPIPADFVSDTHWE